MKAETLLAHARTIGCTFKRERTGDPNWVRLFLFRSDGCTIGRLSFHYGELAHMKFYKDKIQGGPLDESDELYARLEYFVICGGKLEDYDIIIDMAKANILLDLEQKKEARRLLGPNPNHKALQGKDLRREVRRLVKEVANDERDSGSTISTKNHEVDSSSSYQGEVRDHRSLAATV